MKKNSFRIFSITVMLMSMALLSACGSKNIRVENHQPSVDISGLELDRSQSPHIAWVRPGAPELSAYKRFIIDPVQIDYNNPQVQNLSPGQISEMQRYLRDAVTRQLYRGGYEIVSTPQADTLRLSFTITELQAPTAAGNVTAAVAAVSVSVGEVTVQAVFQDALTNRVDAVVVSQHRGARVLNPTPWTTMGDVENAFDTWAKGFRESMDKAHDQGSQKRNFPLSLF